MTIVCALHQDGQTWIGGDSRVQVGQRKMDCARKWLVAPDGSRAVGVAGQARLIYLLDRMGDDLFHKADIHTVCAAIRTAIMDDGWDTAPEKASAPLADAATIYADLHGAWCIPCDWVPVKFPDATLVAAGSGQWEALGAWHALAKRGEPPSTMIREALEAAVAFNSSCGGDLFVRQLGGVS